MKIKNFKTFKKQRAPKYSLMYFLVLNLAIFMRRRKSLFWARRGVCDEFFYSCRQTNGKALFIARKYYAMCAKARRTPICATVRPYFLYSFQLTLSKTDTSLTQYEHANTVFNSVVAGLRAVSHFSLLTVKRTRVSGPRRSREERVGEHERRNLSSFLPLICIILRFHSPRMALRKEGRSLAVYVVACSRRSDRGDSVKKCEQKKTTRGQGRVCF